MSFGYDRSRPVLEDISFTIEPGEMVGVVGRSGSGKSTLVSLIGRLYQCDAGQIRIDGIDVRQANPRQLRRQIGMVPQEPFLFRGSVAANITYGNGQATPEQVLLAARNADSHEFIMRMPFAYETQLGEGGSGLSGGERQRLSIARALLFDPAILILDEATASVDAESERAICQAIRRWARRRTTIVIAHRLSTLQGADRLLVFDQGRLVEQGTPAELLDQGGLYSTLASIQYNLSESRRRFESAAGGDAARDIAETAAEWGGGESLFQRGSRQRSCAGRCRRTGFGCQRRQITSPESPGSIRPASRSRTATTACCGSPAAGSVTSPCRQCGPFPPARRGGSSVCAIVSHRDERPRWACSRPLPPGPGRRRRRFADHLPVAT